MTKYIFGTVLVVWLQCLLFVTDADSYLGGLSPTSAPYFDKTASPNVTIIIDNTAELNCRISNLGDRTIKNVRTRDSGIYECQVGTTPAVGIPIYLTVVEPITTVLGGPDLYIHEHSTINLTCIVRNLPIPPSYIIWTHNNEEVNFDSPRGGVSVITEKGDITTSYLYIQRAKHSDIGEYKCSPSNANNVTVKVHILKGEQSAAIHQISNGQRKIYHRINIAIILLCVLIF